MPILLDDLTTTTVRKVKALDPKYFSAELTGSGKAVGLLNSSVHPGRYPAGHSASTMSAKAVLTKGKSYGSKNTTFTIPLGILAPYSVEHNANRGLTYPVPFDTDRFEVTENATKYDFDVFFDITPQGIVLHKDESGDKVIRDLRILYRMELYTLAKGSTSERVKLVSRATRPTAGPFGAADEFAMMQYSYAPLDDVEEFIKNATHLISANPGNGVYVDMAELGTWMATYDVHERICRLAETWSGDGVADILSTHITELYAKGRPDQAALHHLSLQLRYLESYNVSLSAYRAIHATINGVCPPNDARDLSKQNLNLLMSHTLEELRSLKGQLATPSGTPATPFVLPAHFSVQQRAAISTPEPLTLVQAGAGTGKSTVILGRIEHLVAHGVDPSKITVLSFTNAAADNIVERNPGVHAMTIAKMIHEIYALNHPEHELSSIDTILNSLDIFFPNDDVARGFRGIMLDVKKLKPGSTTILNAFIEAHQAAVIAMLDRMRQTCLELEIVLAYQQIDTMLEPQGVQSEYLIIDEVQDNSIFEFIYLLKYVAKHRENLFIVGDASQTLYEFRASNPKALNALEESGVFSTFQLTTNYRSNQEILDFANVHLADIEANAAAGLQLQANSLVVPTADSFREKVTLDYQQLKYISKFREEFLPGFIARNTRSYIEQCLARGEQVAFLGYKRGDILVIEKELQSMFPNEHVANLMSDKTYSTTVFSQYIKMFWNDVMQVDPADAAFVIYKGINDNLATLSKQHEAAAPHVKRMTSDWWSKNGTTINGWLGLFQMGQMTSDQFYDHLQDNVLKFEIAQNGMKQTLTNSKNRERKEANIQANAKLVVSTVHGAKGLEFDNVVVIHQFDSAMDEDEKRLYYVAFTRAMKTMYVLSYGNVPKPRIESDYDMLVAALEKRDQLMVLQAQGINTDSLSDDDVALALATLAASAVDQDGSGDPIDVALDVATAQAEFTEELARLDSSEADAVLAGAIGGTDSADEPALTAAAA
ncbi:MULTISPECIES: ATP-dependent helicase [unclassified Microbacterium]|uniref:ATP-dependent helicase n=1 Tax=unclassified Microbacterium TaxID=2609290 RepID=UPI0028833031|nr:MULTISPECIES: ATP-dependent helicase [unclassified Microbacterium]